MLEYVQNFRQKENWLTLLEGDYWINIERKDIL